MCVSFTALETLMEDEYDVQQIQKKKDKRTKDSVDMEIEQRVHALEDENYSLVSQARKRLHEGAVKQRQTTEELQRQGEKLKGVTGSAESVYQNVKKGRQITQDIQDEGRLFKFPHVFRSIKNFFSGERRKEAALDKDIKARKDTERKRVDNDIHFEEDASDTDENMKLLLNDLQNMRQEADIQNKEIKKQKLDIKHITKLTKQSDHIMNKTSQELRKI